MNLEDLSLKSFAKILCLQTYGESRQIIRGFKGARYTNIFSRILGEKSRVFSKIFYELLAYYQFLILIHIAKILNLNGEECSAIGSILNKELTQLAMEHKDVRSHIEMSLIDKHFHKLVASYLAGDKSIKGINTEQFSLLLKITGFNKHTKNLVMMSYIFSFSRLSCVLGYIKDNIIINKYKILTFWLCHSNFVNGFREKLNKELKNAFPEKLV